MPRLACIKCLSPIARSCMRRHQAHRRCRIASRALEDAFLFEHEVNDDYTLASQPTNEVDLEDAANIDALLGEFLNRIDDATNAVAHAQLHLEQTTQHLIHETTAAQMQIEMWNHERQDDNTGNAVEHCEICFEKAEYGPIGCPAHTAKCEHRYHVTCLQQWLTANPSCPFCRGKFDLNITRERMQEQMQP